MTQVKVNPESAAATGSGPTFIVAVEQFFPKEERIIDDALALKILPFGLRTFAQLLRIPMFRNWMVQATESQITGGWIAFPVRKRYIDEKVIEAVDSGQVNAIVNLGAGFDTRAYRLPSLSKVPVWELDQSVNIDPKEKRLLSIFEEIPAHVTLARINFQQEDIATVIQRHQYQVDTITFFIWEAVSQYLSEDAVRATFDFLSRAEAGSQLAFTYVLKDFIDGENLYGEETFYQRMVINQKIWHFGWHPEQLPDFLAEYGWGLIEDVSYKELSKRYVTLSRQSSGSMKIERVVYAEKL